MSVSTITSSNMKQQNNMKRSIQDDAIQSSKKRNNKNNNAIGNAKNDKSTNATKNNKKKNKNTMDLPHMRQHCTKHRFKRKLYHDMSDKNIQSCDKCICYVCDVSVKDCKHWSFHCNAEDKGPNALIWTYMREDDKQELYYRQSFERKRQLYILDTPEYTTPLEPYQVAPRSHEASVRVQCRKCKWWSVVGETEEWDVWCKACGRVISTDYFGRKKEIPIVPILPHHIKAPDPILFVPKEGDISLGTKVIPFRIKARDPRKIEPYQQKWQEWEGKEGWIYNESEMKYDFFHHRIGPRPTVSTLLEVMSIVEESKIPDGTRMGFITPRDSEKIWISGFELEALIIDNRNDRVLIEELHAAKNLDRIIEASYNEDTQDGVSILLKMQILLLLLFVIRKFYSN